LRGGGWGNQGNCGNCEAAGNGSAATAHNVISNTVWFGFFAAKPA
jgi:hypothetical protein